MDNPSDLEDSPTKQQLCPICSEWSAKSQFRKFTTCSTKPCNTWCNHCWGKYLKIQLIEYPHLEPQCSSCAAKLQLSDIKQLMGGAGKNFEHWTYLITKAQHLAAGAHECIYSACKAASQPHSPSLDGRIFSCVACSRQECTACAAPEHAGETCAAYQTRMRASHGEAEALSAAYFASRYEHKTLVGMIRPCPACGIRIEKGEKCAHMRCSACKFDFCLACFAPYLGRESVPERGNRAHKEGCSFARRGVEDERFMRKRKGVGEKDGDGKRVKVGGEGELAGCGGEGEDEELLVEKARGLITTEDEEGEDRGSPTEKSEEVERMKSDNSEDGKKSIEKSQVITKVKAEESTD